MLQKILGLNSRVLRAFRKSGLDYQIAFGVWAWFPSSEQRREMTPQAFKDIIEYSVKLFYNPSVSEGKVDM